MSSRFIEHRSAKFSYSTFGKRPAVFFLHGFLENKSMWGDLCSFLPNSFKKICIDLPGHGESDCLGYIHTMEEMADVVRALANHLKIKRLHLVGHSMGGYVALAFAEKYPDMVKSVVLLNSTARADSAEKKNDRKRAIELVKRNHKSFIRNSIPHLFRPKNRRIFKDEIHELKKEALKTPLQGIVASLEGMRIRPDREVLLHFAPYPYLFIAAENDPVLKWESLVPQLNAANVKPLIIPNGHMGHIEDKDLIFPALKEFLQGK